MGKECRVVGERMQISDECVRPALHSDAWQNIFPTTHTTILHWLYLQKINIYCLRVCLQQANMYTKPHLHLFCHAVWIETQSEVGRARIRA